MNIRLAVSEDTTAIAAIYNDEVLHGVATLDIHEKSYEDRKQWVEQHNVGHFYLYVAEIDGEIAGYASLSPYRTKEAYRSTTELSVYIHRDYRRMGVASALMQTLIERAREDDSIHLIVSVITSGNEASVKLHQRFGFDFCGTIHEVGWKMGRYVDIDNWELHV